MRVEIAVLPMINIRSYCDQATLITLVLMQWTHGAAFLKKAEKEGLFEKLKRWSQSTRGGLIKNTTEHDIGQVSTVGLGQVSRTF
jgi:hypothetical protein